MKKRVLAMVMALCLALSLLIWALCLLPALFVASSVGKQLSSLPLVIL